MKKLLPLLIILAGPAAGAAAGIFLNAGGDPARHEAAAESAASEEAHAGEAGPAEDPHAAEEPAEAQANAAEADSGGHGEAPAAEFEYVKIPQQFVVPVIVDSRVTAMVVISISLEITPGTNEAVFAREPRLRDTFLRVMFTHAQSGGFSGSFTVGPAMDDFRQSLQQSAVEVLGDMVNAVLLTDIVRQDV